MKLRVSLWVDTSKESMAKNEADIWFGIQANVSPGKWAHVAENGEALLFRTEEEAFAKLKAIEPEIQKRGAS